MLCSPLQTGMLSLRELAPWRQLASSPQGLTASTTCKRNFPVERSRPRGDVAERARAWDAARGDVAERAHAWDAAKGVLAGNRAPIRCIAGLL